MNSVPAFRVPAGQGVLGAGDKSHKQEVKASALTKLGVQQGRRLQTKSCTPGTCEQAPGEALGCRESVMGDAAGEGRVLRDTEREGFTGCTGAGLAVGVWGGVAGQARAKALRQRGAWGI